VCQRRRDSNLFVEWQGHFGHLILVAFITGNRSLEPLIEGLYAQIHVNLR